MKKKVIIDEVIRRAKSILIFLVIIILANVLVVFIKYPLFQQTVMFLTYNLHWIVAISIIFLIGAVLVRLDNALKYLFPIFNAAASGILVYFIFRIIEFADFLIEGKISIDFGMFELATCFGIAAIVLFGGYSIFFFQYLRKREKSILKKRLEKNKKQNQKQAGKEKSEKNGKETKKRTAFKEEYTKENSVPDYPG